MSEMNKPYILNILKQLLAIPSPSGYCKEIMDYVRDETEKLGYKFETTNKGCGIITVPGVSEETLALTAHVDTLGAMVRSVKPNGTLRFTSVGGYMMGSVEGEYCLVHTRGGKTVSGTILTTKPSVHVYPDARDMKREEAVMEIRLDETVSSKQETEALGIRPGDFVSFDPRTEFKENGWIKSRHLDDKAGVAALFGLLELLKREQLQPAKTLCFLISVYEEVGHGSSYIPASVSEMIAIDMGALGDDLNGSELGVSICAKDSSGPYDYEMTTRLIALAEREKLTYAVDIYPQYGSDASAALRGGNNIRAALIGPGVHASHTLERTHEQAIWNTVSLLTAYVTE
ncbi:M42 family metallopeptidase [Paenibacillus sp. MBLB4367]|uniref:M42 family metallopeptidase n=1 Tax=Paenibacillus sp. MBLB4367 TaxID=3384767 RepID=UPI003907FF22